MNRNIRIELFVYIIMNFTDVQSPIYKFSIRADFRRD